MPEWQCIPNADGDCDLVQCTVRLPKLQPMHHVYTNSNANTDTYTNLYFYEHGNVDTDRHGHGDTDGNADSVSTRCDMVYSFWPYLRWRLRLG